MIPEFLNSIKISDFDYILPDKCIAQKPVEKRDGSKLLLYSKGEISHYVFKDLPGLIPANSQIILNNAKVIPARLKFHKASGAKIEVFLLEPADPYSQMDLALRVTDICVWQCMVGNLKRWKDDENLVMEFKETTLNAKLISREKQLVELSWNGGLPFSSILDLAGKTPLPPYIKREAETSDLQSYQTVFATKEGAVAAPTAGLHFSKDILIKLAENGVQSSELTLYVGAGTFAPVTVENMIDHDMHAEMISVTKETIDGLVNDKIRIAVGTTSLRTLESLYWIGVKLYHNEDEPLQVEKLYPYNFPEPPLTWNGSLTLLKNYMADMNMQTLTAKTAIMIMPGYKFSSVNGLITNFHYPNTTLIMLVAAFIGKDWRKVYETALDNDYRFLSYGDSSLLCK